MSVKMRIWPGGRVEAIYTDDYDWSRHGDVTVQRASHVEPIASGPYRGWWHADMSPLGQSYAYCLWPPRRLREEALADETEHIEARWLTRKSV
jgi:hypothetical protein